MTSWEILTPPPDHPHRHSTWRLMVDGAEVERLTWNPTRAQYCDAQKIARGGRWDEAKSFCEARAKKATKQ